MGCNSSTPVSSEANGKSTEPTKKTADSEPAKQQDKLPTANSHSPDSIEVHTEHAASNAQQDYLDKTCSEVVDEALKEAAAAASRAENTSNSAGQGGESSENSKRQHEPDAVQQEQKPSSRPQTANQQPVENVHSKDIETPRVATTDEQQAAPAAEARTEENAA